jgi:RimJ/RimL family protein N-acetyltransferase
MALPSPVTLTGRFVRLEPIAPAHAAPLAEAAAESRATYGLTFVPDGLAAMEAYGAEALANAERGLEVPFATVDARTNRVVGSTRFYLERWSWPAPFSPVAPVPLGADAVEIGRTWLAASAQRTAINSEAKLLMLEHAFTTWRVYRVSLKTDARNLRSRDAIARLGCRCDGILRAYSAGFDGTVRDVAFFSLLRDEWPAARARLQERLGRP